jgi:hypothetical protein
LLFANFLTAQTAKENCEKYWLYRQRLREQFIKVDLNAPIPNANDIIFPSAKDPNCTQQPCPDDPKCPGYKSGPPYMPYSGYSIPAKKYNPTKHGGTLYFGDSGSDMGPYMGMLATEYELLRTSGQTAAAEETCQEILQAIYSIMRRDILANAIAEHWNEMVQCPDNIGGFEHQCKGLEILPKPELSFVKGPTIDKSGFSGFIIRDDVQWGLGVGEEAAIESVYSDGDPSKKEGYADKYAKDCTCKDHLKWMNGLSYTSGDQSAGILMGLGYVKRFMTGRNDCEKKILELAEKTAYGIVKRLSMSNERRLRMPECMFGRDQFRFTGGVSTTVERGDYQQAQYLAMVRAYEFIAGLEKGESEKQGIYVSNLDQLAFETYTALSEFWIYVEDWGLVIRDGKIIRDNDHAAEDKMGVLLLCNAVGDVKSLDIGSFGQQNGFVSVAKDKNMQIMLLSQWLLHPDQYPTNANVVDLKTYLQDLINSAPMDGPQYKSILSEGPWTVGNSFYRTGFNDSPQEPGMIFSGIDYMLAYNLNKLIFKGESDCVKPAGVVDDPFKDSRTRLTLNGPAGFCPNEENIVYSIAQGYTGYTWNCNGCTIKTDNTGKPLNNQNTCTVTPNVGASSFIISVDVQAGSWVPGTPNYIGGPQYIPPGLTTAVGISVGIYSGTNISTIHKELTVNMTTPNTTPAQVAITATQVQGCGIALDAVVTPSGSLGGLPFFTWSWQTFTPNTQSFSVQTYDPKFLFTFPSSSTAINISVKVDNPEHVQCANPPQAQKFLLKPSECKSGIGLVINDTSNDPISNTDESTNIITIYPNPNDKGDFTIDFKENIEGSKIFISDEFGRFVKEIVVSENQKQITVSGLSIGHYTLAIVKADGTINHKALLVH